MHIQNRHEVIRDHDKSLGINQYYTLSTQRTFLLLIRYRDLPGLFRCIEMRGSPVHLSCDRTG